MLAQKDIAPKTLHFMDSISKLSTKEHKDN